MKKQSALDVALAGLCGVCALIAVVASGAGCERVPVIFAAVLLLLVAAMAAFIIAVRHGVVSRVCIAPFVSLGIIVSVAFTQWPLRLAFALSRQAFEQIGERLCAGERVGPQREGLFWIRNTEVYTSKDIVCLWTDLSGRMGFVRCQPDEIPFNAFSEVSLGDWQLICED